MSDELSKKQKKELEELQNQMIDEAKKVREDFKKTPSDENVTDINIDFDSPYLDEQFKGSQWKKVVKPQYVETFNKWLDEKKKEDNEQ